ncbi:hypothetical protein [Pseudomonas putida]|uniref:hypothetical protein n=1 Tax=Pseudomonas putida TaxID=303 RepID=UPI00276F4C57|nr:hypothetical protein [Pseudomonas putida]EKT4485392.1 hypothetical protein [Pseudomonas putida]MDP9520532.1 hypothetical protein [Pseudomonas putida]
MLNSRARADVIQDSDAGHNVISWRNACDALELPLGGRLQALGVRAWVHEKPLSTDAVEKV